MMDRESLRRVAKEQQRDERRFIDNLRKHPESVKWWILEATLWTAVIAFFLFMITGFAFEAVAWFIEFIVWLALIATATWLSFIRRRWRF